MPAIASVSDVVACGTPLTGLATVSDETRGAALTITSKCAVTVVASGDIPVATNAYVPSGVAEVVTTRIAVAVSVTGF